MRRLVMAATAILGAALLVSAAAAAPVNIIAPLGASKGVSVEEAAPQQDMVLIQPSFFTARFVYGADGISSGWSSPKSVTCDSTVVLQNVLGFNRLALLLTVSFDDSVGAGLFAIQWRGAMNSPSGDTSNTFVNLWRRSNGSAPADTIGSFLGSRARVGGSPWGNADSDTSTLYPGEQFMVLTQHIAGSGYYVPVKYADGSWFTSPYFGLRMRIMNTYFNANVGAATGGLVAIGSCTVNTSSTLRTYGAGYQVGGQIVCETCGGDPTASPPSRGKHIIVRADLVGWRE